MSDNTFDNGAYPPLSIAATPGSRSSHHRVKPRTLAVSCAAVATLAALAWQTAAAFPPSALLGRAIVAGTIGLASSTGARAAPGTPAVPASSSASGASVRVAPEVPAAVLRQLTELKTAYERLVQQTQGTDQRLDRIEADLAELRQQFEKSHAAQAKAQRQARAMARQLRVAQAAATVARVVQEQPRVLSVDSWNGRPSVSVQVGSEVRFFSEGDVVANALVRRADPATERVEFVSASGLPIPAGAAAGEAR